MMYTNSLSSVLLRVHFGFGSTLPCRSQDVPVDRIRSGLARADRPAPGDPGPEGDPSANGVGRLGKPTGWLVRLVVWEDSSGNIPRIF